MDQAAQNKKLKAGRRGPIIFFFSLLTILACIQVILFIVTGWLNAPSGQRWLQDKISASTGMHISLNHFAIVGISELTARQIEIADQSGIIAKITKAKIELHLSELLLRHVAIQIQAKHIELARLPMAKANAAPKKSGPPLAPFTPPKIFLQTAAIYFAADQLVIDAPVAGRQLVLTPKLKLTASFSGPTLSAQLTGRLVEQSSDAHGNDLYLPYQLDLGAKLEPSNGLLTLTSGNIIAAVYQVTASGELGLGIQDNAALKIELQSGDLAHLTGTTNAGNLDFKTSVTGTFSQPIVDLNGAVTISTLVKKGLSALNLQLHAQNVRQAPQGTLKLTTSYQQQPAQLALNFSKGNGQVLVRDLAGQAPGIKLNGQLTLDQASGLLSGQADAIFDLAAYHSLLGETLGKGRMHLTLQPRANKQAASVIAQFKQIRRDTLSIKAADLTAQFDDVRSGQPTQLSLNVQQLQAPNATFNKLQAKIIPAGAKQYHLQAVADGQGQLPFTLAAATTLQGTPADWALHHVDIRLSSKPGALNINGDIDQRVAALTLTAQNFVLGALPGAPPVAAKMALSGKAQLNGNMQAPRFSSDLTLRPNARAPRNKYPIAVRLQTALADGALRATLAGSGPGVASLSGDMAMPMRLSLQPFALQLPPQTPLKGQLNANLRLNELVQDFLPPDIGLGGTLQASVTVRGTMAQPQISGNAALNNGALSQESSGLFLDNLTLRSLFQGKSIKLANFTAQDGKGGRITANGTVDLGQAMPIDMRIKTENLNPLRNSNFFNGLLSANLTMAGKQPHYDLKGAVMARPVNITIPDRFGSTIPQLNIVKADQAKTGANFLEEIKLMVKIDAPNQFFVRGWGLDAEFGGALDVTGTLAAPEINGTLDSRRGRFEQFGKRFDISTGTLRFEGTVPPSPYLDIAATTTTNGITAEIDLTGPATLPVLKLSAVPALPEDEVLSHILFGKDISSISPFQAVQIAQTLQQFSGQGGGGVDPLTKLRGATGLDDLSVNSSDTGPTTVGAGKYLTNRVYLSVQQGADTKSSAAQIQVDLTQHLKATSKVSADDDTGGGLLWQWDY